MPEESIWKVSNDDDFTGYTLILPSVAFGNVGQLVCDLLISSLKMQKISFVYTTAVIPVVGHDPYESKSDKISTSCEIYKSESKKLVVLQLRAPVIYKYGREFLQALVTYFKAKNIVEIIILTSSFAHEKKQILTSPFRYIANDLCVRKDKAKLLNWLEHETTDGRIKIYGGGFASVLFGICDENSMPCLILFKYCSEGDNRPDAYEMVHYLSSLLPMFADKFDLTSHLSQPPSWVLVYGGPPPEGIY